MHVQLQHSEAYQNCQSCRKITHSVKLKKTLFKALFSRGVNEPELEIILGIIYKNIKNMSLKLKKKKFMKNITMEISFVLLKTV